MPPIDEIRIRQVCADLIVRYAYLNDERRFGELTTLFTEDAVLYRPSAPEQGIMGRSAILAAFRKRPLDLVTFHVTSDILVEVQSAGRAHARSRILLLSGSRPQEPGALPAEVRSSVPGMFRDSFALTDEGWKFSERRGIFWI